MCRLRLKCDGTRAETRFRLSAKRTSPFKSAGASVQSTTGSRGVRIRGSNDGYTMFQGSVKSAGYPLHSPVSTSLPLPCVTRNWTEFSLAQHRFPIRFVSFFVCSVECLEMMPSWCRQVNCGNCGIPWVNCAVLCVKDDWKWQFWGLRYYLSKLRSLLSFSVSYDVTH
jgi:hypothetical protein